MLSVVSFMPDRYNTIMLFQGSVNKCQKKSSRKIGLLDLPEQVCRQIFGYLSEDELYFTVRTVCWRLRYVVDGYVQLGEYFI